MAMSTTADLGNPEVLKEILHAHFRPVGTGIGFAQLQLWSDLDQSGLD